MSIIKENRINKIYQYIESGPYTIEFNLEFGKGIDSTVNPNDSRMDYTTHNKFLIDEVVFDDGAKNYRVIGTEAPIVSRISNLKVRNAKEHPDYTYNYGIGFAIDKEEPKYRNDISSEPYNIERDWSYVAYSC